MDPHLPSLRVALVIDLFPPIVGGAETHARDLAGALVRAGASVTVLTRRAREELPEHEILEPGVEVVRIGSPGSPRWGKYRFIPDLLREWKKRSGDFDLIYLCGFRVLGWPLTGAARRAKVPIVLRAEVLGEMSGEFVWSRPGEGESRWLKRFFRPLICVRNWRLIRSGRFLAISSLVGDEYRDAGVPAPQIRKIPNGIDTERFCPAVDGEKARLRTEFFFPNGPVFLYSGKLNRGKGLPDLLTAWRRYVEKGGAGLLVLVGSGGGQFLSEEASLIRRVTDEGLRDRVRFTGYRQDVERWLKAADVFVFPSEAESFGLAPLEANACGLPVICTDAGALAETVPDGLAGIRVPVGDPEAICAAMEKLAADPEEARKIGERARARVVAEYSFAAVAESHMRWFRELREEIRS
ncbi:MAG: glycosyltransferase family 4 protein [Puniceicoccales bacterium]